MENTTIPYDMDMDDGVTDATLQEMLARSIGKLVLCELLMGLRAITVREGILSEVGKSYFILEDPSSGTATSCDLYSLKFMTFPTQTSKGYTAAQLAQLGVLPQMQQQSGYAPMPQQGAQMQPTPLQPSTLQPSSLQPYRRTSWYRLE